MIDIIIVNYNSTDYLINCIQSIYDSLETLKVNILVHDNASNDGVEKVIKLFPQVSLKINTHNRGFAAAVNRALKESNFPYVVLLNPDSKVKAGLFESTINYMENNPDVGIIGPKILDSDGTIQGSARSFPTPLTAFFGRTSLFSRLFPNNRITSANLLTTQCDGKNPMEVDWVSGACMVVRRKAIDNIGPLDERFFMYWEDADWCRRMWDAKWKVVYFPKALAVHYVGKSSNHLILRSIFEFHKSVYLLFEKYKLSIWLMKPVIALGLFIRLCSTMSSNYLNLKLDKLRRDVDVQEAVCLPEKIERIKVLRMIARLNIGGPAIHVHLLTRGLDKERFESQLVTGKISAQEGDMSYLFQDNDKKPTLIPELQRDIRLNMDLKAMIRIFQILEKEKPHIVHTHTAKAGFTARIAVFVYNLIFRRNIYIVHTFHGHVFEGYFSNFNTEIFLKIERIIAKFTDVIIAISKTQRKELVGNYKIAPPEKIRTVELGFNLEPFFSCESLKGSFREKLGIDNNRLLIGIIGRLVPIKNHKMFLSSARIFIDENPDIPVNFLIVGDGELREFLTDYCEKMDLNEYVKFCGWIQDVAKVYSDLDILALTSINEGTPVSIIEAMASSVPVIATDAGGVRDLLGKPEDSLKADRFSLCERGILCRIDDKNSFAQGLKYLVKRDRIIKQILRARSFVKERYSQDRLLREIENLYYQQIMGTKNEKCFSSPFLNFDKSKQINSY